MERSRSASRGSRHSLARGNSATALDRYLKTTIPRVVNNLLREVERRNRKLLEHQVLPEAKRARSESVRMPICISVPTRVIFTAHQLNFDRTVLVEFTPAMEHGYTFSSARCEKVRRGRDYVSVCTFTFEPYS